MDTEKINEESSANPKNLDAESSFHPAASVAVGTYDKITCRTPAYLKTMFLDVENIDKDNKKIWRKIYEATDEPYL